MALAGEDGKSVNVISFKLDPRLFPFTADGWEVTNSQTALAVSTFQLLWFGKKK